MDDALAIDRRQAQYELRCLSTLGMSCFLVAAALGSTTLMAAGSIMWGGFLVLARGLSRQPPSETARGQRGST